MTEILEDTVTFDAITDIAGQNPISQTIGTSVTYWDKMVEFLM